MKPLILLLTLLALGSSVRGQQFELIGNTDGRKTISLDGQWQTIIDPYESGFYDYRYQPSNNGYFRNAKPKSKSDLIEYDFDKSSSLKVPGDWNTQSDQLFFYEGTVWYKKSFDYQWRPNTRVFVYFGAANYQADVYLNGQKLGQHEGGFTPFNFEITRFVRDKDNFLVVKVDNKRRRDAVPTLMTDWWNYGGLTREVKLIETPDTFIHDYFIQLQKGSRNRIAGWVRLDGNRLNQKITIRIPELQINRSFTTNSTGSAVIDFNADLTLWSPENPRLYDVAVEAETDRVRDQIGFRSIETRGTDILLNGKPIFLRGVCLHEESPGHNGGRANSPEHALKLLGWAKEMGANFVRLAHYPHNEHMVREADRTGILVWSEIPVYWTIQWENPATLENARNQLTEMIARDKNRAAVVIWSVANETPLSDARLSFLKNLVSHARSLDSTRLLSAAMERHYINPTTQMIDDPLGEFLDVLGCNEYVGWYDGLPAKADGLEWKSKYDKPLIMSEFGGDALYGLRGDALTRWSEEYQESIYQHQIGMLKRIPFLRGTAPWILTDFRSPRRPLPGIQDYWNRKGLISNRGEKKKAFYVMQQWYQELAQTQIGRTFVIETDELSSPLTFKDLCLYGDLIFGAFSPQRHRGTETQRFILRSERTMMTNPTLSRRSFSKMLGVTTAFAALGTAREARASLRLFEPNALSSTATVVRLSSNENPYGPSPAALKAMSDGFGLTWRYPDEYADMLAEDLAKMHNVPAEQVLLGDGSGEILKLCAAAFTSKDKKLVTANPTFESIARHAGVAGAEVMRIDLTPDYRHDLSKMLAATKGASVAVFGSGAGLVYICNPNNPTASITPKGEISDFLAKVSPATIVLVDEAYHHYVETNDYESVIPLVKQYPNLIVARTFSKIYGMAGLRCGYCVTQRANVERLRTHQIFDSVNIMALVAARASLADTEHIAQGRKLNNEVKKNICAELETLGYRYIPSHTNFIMIDLRREARPVISALRARGVEVGRLFPALPNFLRVTIGTAPEMKQFLSTFRAVMV